MEVFKIKKHFNSCNYSAVICSFIKCSRYEITGEKAEKSTIKYAKDKEEVQDNSSDFVVENNHDEKNKITKNRIITIIAKIQI